MKRCFHLQAADRWDDAAVIARFWLSGSMQRAVFRQWADVLEGRDALEDAIFAVLPASGISDVQRIAVAHGALEFARVVESLM